MEQYFLYTNPHPTVEPTEQVIRGDKIGRNDPCPCGSGKKYKKCCLLKEAEKAAQEEAELQAWLEQDFAEGAKLLAEYEAEQAIRRHAQRNQGLMVVRV